MRHIDWTGIVLLLIGLAMAQLVLERGQQVDWFSSNWIIAGAAVASVGLMILIVHELVSDEPVINFRLLRNPELRGVRAFPHYSAWSFSDRVSCFRN